MSKRQAPKSGWHQRKQSDLRSLEKSLKRDWRNNGEPTAHAKPMAECLPDRTLDLTVEDPAHMKRANEFELPADFTPESLLTQTFHRYIDVRGSVTQRQLDEARKRFVKVVDQMVFTELIPDTSVAEVQDVLDVARGIAVAKVAISRTSDYIV